MRSVAFISPLGGVGRTTLTAHCSALLAARGMSVLAVDLSAQNMLGVHLGLGSAPQTGWQNAVQAHKWWGEAALENSTGVRLLPHGAALAQDPPPAHWLQEQLAQLDLPKRGVVLLDTPVLPGALAQQALACADLVVWVLDASPRAVLAHALLQTWMTRLRPTQAWAMVATGVDPRSKTRRSALAQLRQQWGQQLLPYVLHQDEYLLQAQSQALCVHQLAPQAQSAHDLQGIAAWIKDTLAPTAQSARIVAVQEES